MLCIWKYDGARFNRNNNTSRNSGCNFCYSINLLSFVEPVLLHSGEVAILTGHSSKLCLHAVTTPGDWRGTLLFPWPNDPAISRQLRWTNRNHSSRSEFINCKSVTSHKKHTEAEWGSAARLFLPSPWPLDINQTTRREHPLSLSSSQEGVCKWGPWPKSNSRACSLIANYRPQHPNQRPFKGMISDSFLQSSEKYERARRRCECLDLWCKQRHEWSGILKALPISFASGQNERYYQGQWKWSCYKLDDYKDVKMSFLTARMLRTAVSSSFSVSQ